MGTNPIGKNTKTIGINMAKEMADELEKRANSMHLSTSKYCKVILTQWLESGNKLTLQEQKQISDSKIETPHKAPILEPCVLYTQYTFILMEQAFWPALFVLWIQKICGQKKQPQRGARGTKKKSFRP